MDVQFTTSNAPVHIYIHSFGAAPGAAQQPGQAQPGENDAQMTEDEMIEEAINRSLQEM